MYKGLEGCYLFAKEVTPCKSMKYKIIQPKMLDVRCLIEKSLRVNLFICIPRSIHLRRRNLLTWHQQSSCHQPSMIKMHLSSLFFAKVVKNCIQYKRKRELNFSIPLKKICKGTVFYKSLKDRELQKSCKIFVKFFFHPPNKM